ncbi:MAG: double-strand break repair protein AddB [Devosia sp.]|nr:double-strand break repair protein AddB [Devosia sp.]
MSLYSIPPHVPFLPALAGAVMEGRLLGDWPRTGPFWLSDVTIVVPTQRARKLLAQAFLDHPQSSGLLPDIRTFGGEVEDEEPFLPPFEAPPLPAAASALHRRLVLSRLVAAWAHSAAGRDAFSTPPTAAEIFSMADSLGRVFDDLAVEERGAAELRALDGQLGPELGVYWQQTLTFLEIALNAWPQILASKGLADPSALRGARLDRQAEAAALVYGDRPVIAAGSTGSIPATARLLRAIARLPRGALVLPGLDTAMSAKTHAALLDPTQSPHGHPQYHLARLLRTLGAGPGEVVDLAQAVHPRTPLMHRALALTAETAQWSAQRLAPAELEAALAGVAIIAARHEDEEARAIALAARSALAQKRSVGIITPDRNLARRIAAELARFGVSVDDAAGAPLFHAPAGRLARQVLALAVNRCVAVDLVALLRHRAALFGRSRGDIGPLTDAIELGLLRGQRVAPGLDGLRAALASHLAAPPRHGARKLSPAEGEAIAALFDAVEAAIAPLARLFDERQIDAARFAGALYAAVSAISTGAPLRGREELEGWAREMAAHEGDGHPFAPIGLDTVLSALMSGFQVRNRLEQRSDIAIWGQLEARLMSPDLVILGALNEDKWPEPADPGPWLSRGMRLAAGLEPPERLQGLAAHDFVQAMGNSDVIIAYARRVGTSPASPSRFVQRLDAFIGEKPAETLRLRGRTWLDAARALDEVAATRPAPRPLPNPPAHLRPRRLSVTEVETLMRSPYDLYARHVLGLKRLDPLGEMPDARERGTIIHDAFARFVIAGHDPAAPDAFEKLMEIAAEAFSGLETIGERRDIWLRRFATAGEQFLAFERQRGPRVKQRHAEIRGEMNLALAEPFLISGQADRVDEMLDGSVEIIDFKTGIPPSKGMMKGFEAPQLLVEALMARAGGMLPRVAGSASALTYIKIGLGPDAFVINEFVTAEAMALMDAADEIGRRMQSHIDFFLLRDTPMPARLLPLASQRFAGPYDHLSRLAEWTSVDGGEESE